MPIKRIEGSEGGVGYLDPKRATANCRYAKGGDMNTLKRQGSYKTQYKLVSGFLRGDKYTALTANTLLDTTRLTNNVIQCERDGLKPHKTTVNVIYTVRYIIKSANQFYPLPL